MLHHISIAVDAPLHVAKVIAEIWHGRVVPFAICPGSYIVLKGDDYGTAIELLPSGIEMRLKQKKVVYEYNHHHSQFASTQVTISVPISQYEVEQIAMREGWRISVGDRGQFQVIEFWLENKFLLELMTPIMSEQYLKFIKQQKLESPTKSTIFTAK
ncbi:MAG: hypothetical protein QNJ63_17635 [Calothrix sp. MO_192.B10]|nr:hypothetical protein [Calothrix sp. MO_192.B10]